MSVRTVTVGNSGVTPTPGYSSVQAALSAMAGSANYTDSVVGSVAGANTTSLVTDAKQWIIQIIGVNNELTATGTAGSPIDTTAYTQNSSYFIQILPYGANGFRDNSNVRTNALAYTVANGVAIRKSTTYGQVANISGYTQLYGLQLKSSVGGICVTFGNAGCVIDSCILDTSGQYALQISSAVTVINSLIVSRYTSSTGGTINISATGTTIENCTIVNVSTGTNPALKSTGGTQIIKGCVVFGFSSFSSGTWTVTNCVTDLASISGATQVSFNTSAVISTTTDFRAVSSGTLAALGYQDTSTGPPNATVDITGTARNKPPYAGCWEVANTFNGFPFLFDVGIMSSFSGMGL